MFVCDGHPTIDSIPHTNFDLEILSKDADRIVVQVENGNISAGSADPTLYYDESEFANPIRESFTPREVFQGLYPRLFLLPNGQLFSASSLRSLPILPKNGKNAEDERINKDILALEPSLMADKVTFNLEYRTYVGRRIFRDNSYVFQPRQPWENRQIYEAPVEAPDAHGPIWGFDEPAVLLPMTVSSDSENVRSQPRVLTFVNGRDCTIEPLALNPTWKHALRTRDESLDFTGTRRIDRKRRYGNLVLLPDGSVMVIGGSDDYYGAPLTDFEENRSVFEVEYFVPGERSDSDFWRTDRRARLAVPRRYHSTAILLLDGRVMVGGGNVSENYNKQVLKESSFRDIEIITPDYYENGPQPEFFIDNASVGYGDLIAITLREGTSVNNLSKFAMFIRCASFTHAFGYDQRAVQLLPYGPLTPTKYDVRIPNNSNIMPPGYYMLFIVSQSGVPSCGKMVMIGS